MPIAANVQAIDALDRGHGFRTVGIVGLAVPTVRRRRRCSGRGRAWFLAWDRTPTRAACQRWEPPQTLKIKIRRELLAVRILGKLGLAV